eukprot:817494-Rhodomonas_salina.2
MEDEALSVESGGTTTPYPISVPQSVTPKRASRGNVGVARGQATVADVSEGDARYLAKSGHAPLRPYAHERTRAVLTGGGRCAQALWSGAWSSLTTRTAAGACACWCARVCTLSYPSVHVVMAVCARSARGLLLPLCCVHAEEPSATDSRARCRR